MFTKNLLLTLILCSSFISCEKDIDVDINPILPPGPIIPLAEGNEWFYKFYQNGELTDSIEVSAKGNVILEYDGAQYNSFVYGNIESESRNRGYFYANDDSGGIIQVGAFAGDDTLIIPSTLLKYPVMTGEKWSKNRIYFQDGTSSSITVESDNTSTVECVDESKMITIGSTDFPCIVYKESFKLGGEWPATQISYSTPGIGVVIEVTAFNDRSDSLVLYSYKLY